MEEHLVGYLLGTLDPVTHRRVEAHLKSHPEAAERLALLEQMLAPLDVDAGHPEPPPGLVVSTLARVAEHRCALPAAPPASPHQTTAPQRWARRIDWLVAASVLIVVAGLGTPWLAGAWNRHQRLACENNL